MPNNQVSSWSAGAMSECESNNQAFIHLLQQCKQEGKKSKGPAAQCSISPHRKAPGKGHVDATQVWGIFFLPGSPQKDDYLLMDLFVLEGLGVEC